MLALIYRMFLSIKDPNDETELEITSQIKSYAINLFVNLLGQVI